MKRSIGSIFVLLLIVSAAQAQMRITEWMYNGAPSNNIGEFVEFTNIGSSAIDMAGWSFDDDSHTAGSQDLSALGSVSPGESVLLTDDTAASFSTNWGLASTVKVIGGNINNLGRADEINLYDAASTLVDRLTYNDQGTGTVKGPRTNKVSANPTALTDLGTNNASRWVLSAVGDRYGSWTSVAGEIGNPGKYVDVVPEPAAIVALLTGMFTAGIIARFRRK
jgi:predicted extracellular nuclease